MQRRSFALTSSGKVAVTGGRKDLGCRYYTWELYNPPKCSAIFIPPDKTVWYHMHSGQVCWASGRCFRCHLFLTVSILYSYVLAYWLQWMRSVHITTWIPIVWCNHMHYHLLVTGENKDPNFKAVFRLGSHYSSRKVGAAGVSFNLFCKYREVNPPYFHESARGLERAREWIKLDFYVLDSYCPPVHLLTVCIILSSCLLLNNQIRRTIKLCDMVHIANISDSLLHASFWCK